MEKRNKEYYGDSYRTNQDLKDSLMEDSEHINIVSSTPFDGCYDRSYYDKYGMYHKMYVGNPNYATKKSGLDFTYIIILLSILPFFFLTIFDAVEIDSRIDGNPSRIFIEDRSNIIASSDEEKLAMLFEEIYEKSGMPITLITDNFSWRDNYDNIGIYSEELYYSIGYDESAMLILFASENFPDAYVWEYNVYRGKDTEKCLSDKDFGQLLNTFFESFYLEGNSLPESLVYSFDSIMNKIGGPKIEWVELSLLFFFVLIMAAFSFLFYCLSKSERDAYKYFKQYPEELSDIPIRFDELNDILEIDEDNQYEYERPEL